MSEVLHRLRRTAAALPDDEAAHRVYADALMEAGDPLGDFIAAQCTAPSLDVPGALWRRVAGPLRRFSDDVVVRRGLLREVHLRRLTPTEYQRLIGHPAWDTVRAVAFRRSRRARTLPAQLVTALLAHPVCGHVRDVGGLDFNTFVALTGQPLALDVVGVEDDVVDFRRSAGTSLQLRTLGVCTTSPGSYREWLLGAGRRVFESLETLVFYAWPYEELSFLEVAPARLTRLVGRRTESVRREGRWHLMFEPLPGPAEWGVGQMLTRAEEALERHAHHFASITLRVPDMGRAATGHLVARAQGVPVRVELQGRVPVERYDDTFRVGSARPP